MAATSTVTIGSDTVTVYALTADPESDTDSFWNVRLGAEATAWAAAASADKLKALASAADWLDRSVSFSGTKTVASQDREWPRDNASNYCTGAQVADGTTPDGIFSAQAWLAGALLVDASSASSSGQGSNIKSVGAGSASVEFFRPTTGTSSDFRLPQVAHDYSKCYSTNDASSIAGPSITGTSQGSSFCENDAELNGGWA